MDLGVEAQVASEYMRVAALAVWVFDFLQILPKEARLYRQQMKQGRCSLACLLFILVRYLGAFAMVTDAAGYYGFEFTSAECHTYYRVPAIAKVAAAQAGHLIFFWRTYAIADRKRWATISLIVVLAFTLALEVVGNIFIIPIQIERNCFYAAESGRHSLSWLFYAGGMMYDLVIVVISSCFLLFGVGGWSMPRQHSFSFALFRDGMVYIIIATIVNVLNVVWFIIADPEVHAMFTMLAVALTTIISTRMITNLQEFSPRNAEYITSVPGQDEERNRPKADKMAFRSVVPVNLDSIGARSPISPQHRLQRESFTRTRQGDEMIPANPFAYSDDSTSAYVCRFLPKETSTKKSDQTPRRNGFEN